MLARLAVLLVATGCMTDPAGDSCIWAPGNDGYCPGDSSGGGSSGPEYHRYISAVAVPLGDELRVVMTGTENSGTGLETTIVAHGAAGPMMPVTLDGAALQKSIVPQLSAIDGKLYLAWSDTRSGGGQLGAMLRPDGSIDPSTITIFGRDYLYLRRVGHRHLLVSRPAEGVIEGTFVEADGTLAETIEIAHDVAGETREMTHDSDGSLGMWAMAFYRSTPDGHRSSLHVVRVMGDGRVLDPIELASWTPGEDGASGGFSLAVLPDRSVTVLMKQFWDRTPETHVFHIPQRSQLPADGSGITESVVPTLPVFREVVAHGEHLLGISTMATSDYHEHAQLHLLDRYGAVVGEPTSVSIVDQPRAFVTPSGFGLLQTDGDVSVTMVDREGRPGPATPIAETYELDSGGCNASGARGSWLVLVALGLLVTRSGGRRERRRLSRSS